MGMVICVIYRWRMLENGLYEQLINQVIDQKLNDEPQYLNEILKDFLNNNLQ